MRTTVMALAVSACVVGTGVPSVLAGPPQPTVLRVVDPVGDSTSAKAGDDLTSIALSSRTRGKATTFEVRLEVVGPLTAGTIREVSFAADDCTFHLFHAPQGALTTTPPTNVTYDCGPGSELYLGLGTELAAPAVRTTERSITWTMGLDSTGPLRRGAELTGITGWTSVSDDTQQLWGPAHRGLLSYDTAVAPTTFRVG